ncbi:MAG: Crp/Fnr family transcriptional regulator [Deltaproteobacteria bacterium]|nr:Crp/Fnr family transcriptional regulator [Deltaproteobacteria bacterium]
MLSVPKEQFRLLIAETGRRMGLTDVAVAELVRRAQLGRWRKGQEIFTTDDAADLVNFLVSGAVKVTCPAGNGMVGVQLVRPGQFFGLNWYAERGRPRLFGASAFTDCTVAMVTSEMMAVLIASAPPQSVMRIMSYSWRALSRLLHEKCSLLGLRLEERLKRELGVLARDFGREQDDGVIIDVPLTHADLAEFAIASRANVARVMKSFERNGLVARAGRKVFLTSAFFEREHNPDFDLLVQSDLLRLPSRQLA